ncbi:Coatomer subunit beta'-3 [Zea mays]|uniref:Coatomer subunit beta'-3 n=1 Tax=Zea mays TaxID=4577 RepID=A0A1D6G3Q5_MAIZE|nr:Coatomer subunit beta'-3 [Zea mays]
MAAAAADFRSRRSCGRHVHLYPLHLCPLNGVHSLCPAVWSKYRRWSMLVNDSLLAWVCHNSTLQLEMAEECLLQAKDLSGLLLLYSSLGDAEGIEKLASLAKEHGKNNVAFLCLFMLGKVEDCIQLLVDSNRIPEAALLARSYLPSKVLEIVAIWRDDLSKINPKATESLADPSEYPNLFEDWQVALTVEKSVASQRNFLLNPRSNVLIFHCICSEN